MKIAFLILAHNNYEHLKRFLTALNDDSVHFFIHIDAKSPAPENLPFSEKTVFVPRETIYWGGFSMVKATLNLLEAAFSQGFDYYILASGQDYPVKPHAFLQKCLNEGGEYMDVCISEEEIRVKTKKVLRYYWEKCDRRNKTSLQTLAVMGFEKSLRLLGVKKDLSQVPPIHHGAQWWALSHSCISYILNYLKENPQYLSFFKTALCPDESFFQTIVVHSPFKEQLKEGLTYADWSRGKTGPAMISLRHLQLLEKEEHRFLARKFDDCSLDIISLIDEKLRRSADV
ncbi:MAG: beta-1,6-N-acetylglucosaminyltransferase [Dysgonamonadaceae bacterium]|jgi:hypothetical protein|nr:beta-1,6-N-acetylglucosaminyltransferase [Dysgonamonadaceae bacterium]